MINQDEKTTSDKVENFREIAETHLVEKDGKWMLKGFDNRLPNQGFDLNQTYENRQQAVEAAVKLLQANKLKAA